MSVKKIIIGVVLFLGIVLTLSLMGRVVESVEGGEIHVKQAAVSGDLTVRTEEGLYNQMFGKITKYFRTSETYLSNDDLDGGKGAETNATTVRFGDGGTAEVGSVTQWRLPLGEVEMIKIHRNYRGFSSLSSQVRQWIIEVEKQTSSTFRADETYSTRRNEFQQLISDQIQNGLYMTETVEVEVPTNEEDADGNTIMATETRVEVKRDESGQPIVTKPGIFVEYGLTLVNHSLKDIDYDETIDALISQKKKAEQEKAVAITNAEKAKQDAITAEETGKARIAEAKANEEVKKITAVTQQEASKAVAILKAEQTLNVAELAKETASENASARLITERAEADANALKVKAGLTPQQAAEWKYKTEVDSVKAMADGIARADFPDIYMANGGDSGSGSSVLDTVAINQTLEILAKMND